MQCPLCQADNPPSADRCGKCSTPLPISDLTLADTNIGQTEAWSVAVTPRPSSEAASKGQLEPGSLVGDRFEILQLLGQGGMGAVYKARDIELDRLVAIKLIRPELASHPEILRRFKQELLLARDVTHRNVIRIFDLGQAQGIKFITMEYVEGRDLRSMIHEKGKMTAQEAAPIVLQIAAALEAAHHAGVVHRDLKPQNIMLDKDGRVYVMDFGIARSLETPGMTQTGALMGTPEYMSPEQAKGEKVDARSDLFALGIIFYEMLTGNSPFRADTAMATMFKRTKERATPLVQLNLGVPSHVSDIVSRCLEIEPEQRYQTARAIIDDVEAWQAGVPRGTIVAASSRLRYAPHYQKKLLGAAAVILLAVTGYLLRGKLLPSSAEKPAAAVQPLSLAILPFHNASSDTSLDWIGAYLADTLGSDVGQSDKLRTVSSDRLHQILKDLHINANTEFDPDTVKRLAELSTADMVISGRYAKLGDQIRIDASLLDLKHDRKTPLSAEAPNEKQLLQSIAKLAESIQQNLALPPDAVKDLRARSFRPSSDSVEALRSYSEGLQLVRQGNNQEAMKSFDAAVQQDPQFALAYSHLGLAYANLGYDDRAEQASRKAMELAEKLPPQEKYLILADHARIINDNAKAIEAYENLAKAAPDDADVRFALGGLYESSGALDKARDEYARVLSRDPKQVEALLAAGRVDAKMGNPQAALERFNNALSLSIQLGNDEEKSRILQAIGKSYRALDKLDDALRNYQESLAIKRRLGQKRGMASSLTEIAQIQGVQGKQDAALASFNEALQLSREIGDKQGIADTLHNLGSLYDNRGNYEQALKVFKESLQIERELRDETGEALRLNGIGHTYFSMGDFDNARTYFDQALRLYEKFKNSPEIARTVHNLAETSAKMGDYDQAQAQYLRALGLRRSSGDKRGSAQESFGMGTMFEYQGRYGAALASQEEALKTFGDSQDRGYWMAAVLAAYGRALSQLGRFDEARMSLEQGLTLAHQLKNQALVARILNFQGDTFWYQADFKSARPLYEQALREASGAKDRSVTLVSRINLTKLAVTEGRSQTSIGPLKTLAQDADTLGLKYLSAECSVYLGEALLNTRQYAAARQELEVAVRKGERLGLKALLAQAHYLLAQTLQRSGAASDASTHSREARRLLEEIRSESKSDALLNRADLKRIAAEPAGNS